MENEVSVIVVLMTSANAPIMKLVNSTEQVIDTVVLVNSTLLSGTTLYANITDTLLQT